MKKYSFIIIIIILNSCQKPKTEVNSEINSSPVSIESVSTLKSEGLVLLESSDCLSCHKENTKLVGPSFKDISLKYDEDDADLLVSKIINGGSGNWGEVPMNPHPEISNANAKIMVEYILTLKK